MAEKKLTFKYKFAKDYNPKYVNGAYGGIGPRGEFIINFYLERLPVPHSDIHTITEDGQLSDLKDRSPKDLESTLIRFVDTGVVLNMETAKKIHQWLGAQINQLEGTKEADNE